MELLQLRYFRDAAICENFSEVSRKHLVPQSYISKTIKNLEKELNTTLFDRNGKKVYLNDNGRYFLEKIAPALESIDEGVRHFSMTKQSNISLYIQAGSRFASLIIADYLHSSSDIFISCINQTSYDMSTDSFDFTFMQLQEDMTGYKYVEVLNDSFAIAVHSSLPLASKESVAIEELANEEFINYYRGVGIRDFTDAYCKSHGFTPYVRYEVTNGAAYSYYLQKRKAIGLVSVASWYLNFERDITLIPLEAPLNRTLILAWDERKTLTNEEELFKQYVIQWFNDLLKNQSTKE